MRAKVEPVVSRDEILWCYRAILGREPESDDVYQTHAMAESFDELRRTFLRSDEFSFVARDNVRQLYPWQKLSYCQKLIAFIHIPKTGGTAVKSWLSRYCAGNKLLDAHYPSVSHRLLGDLNEIDVIAGHISYEDVMMMPRQKKVVISCFREPESRLLSLHRFYRSHRTTDMANPLVHIAKQSTAKEFFSDERVRASSAVNNSYLNIFAFGRHDVTDIDGGNSLLECALANIRKVDVILIMEDINNCIRNLASVLGISDYTMPQRLNVTSLLPTDDRDKFEYIPEAEVDNHLRDIMSSLIVFDKAIYNEAKKISICYPY